MPQQVTISSTSLKQLADLLENAGRVARGLSEGKSAPFAYPIPELKYPAHVPDDEQWFWADDWQRGEREVNQALRRGDYDEFESAEETIADLHRHL